MKIVHWVVALVIKPEDPNSIPGTHKWKERTKSSKLSSDFHRHTYCGTCALTHAHTHINIYINNKSLKINYFETDSCSVIQVGFGLLGSTDPPIIAFWIVGTADPCHPGGQKNHCNVTLRVILLHKGFQSWVVTVKESGNSGELVAVFCLLGCFPVLYIVVMTTAWWLPVEWLAKIPQWLLKVATTVLRQGEAWRITQCPRSTLNESKGWMWFQVNSTCYIPWQRGHENKFLFFSQSHTQE